MVIMAIGIMFGAIASHMLILGIVVQDDGGLLFTLALVVLICSGLIVLLKKDLLLELRQQHTFYGILLYVASTIFVLYL